MRRFSSSAALPTGLFGCLLSGVMTAFAAGEKTGIDDFKECVSAPEIKLLASETASAGYVTNILSRPGSIRVASNRMLTSALDTAKSKQPTPLIIFTSTPELSKKSGEDDQMCARHQKDTEKHPLEFEDKHFATADELTEWIMDFTRGKGEDGKSLYELCPGNCSPRYTWWIEPMTSGMKVRSHVVCGLPRDRDGNKYHLTIALAPACSVDDKQEAAKATQ